MLTPWQRELYAQRAVVHSSSNLARKFQALQEAHDVLKLETAKDKAALAGQRCAHSFSVATHHTSPVFRCRLAASAPGRSGTLGDREIGMIGNGDDSDDHGLQRGDRTSSFNSNSSSSNHNSTTIRGTTHNCSSSPVLLEATVEQLKAQLSEALER
jgi:hypothetical protein